MQPEFEVHNFDENQTPRQYEAVYVAGERLLIKVLVYQHDRAAKGQKPLYRWNAMALAWTPGQNDEDYTRLCHLNRHETAIRDVLTNEATEDTWLTAARIDAEKLIERASVFADVLLASAKDGKRAKVGR